MTLRVHYLESPAALVAAVVATQSVHASNRPSPSVPPAAVEVLAVPLTLEHLVPVPCDEKVNAYPCIP